MIYLEAARSQLSPLEDFGLTVLVDLSALLRVASPSEKVISLAVNDDSAAGIGEPVTFGGGLGTVGISRRTLAAVGTVAGAIAEQESRAEDQHQRVPSEVNAMVAGGATQSPWISAVARGLREAVLASAEGRVVRTLAPWPGGHRWAAAFTHDLDVVRYWPLFAGLRVLELARKGKVGQALRVGASAMTSTLGDPVGQGVREILAIEREHAVTSTWFVIAGVPTFSSTRKGDVTYSVDDRQARRILASIGEAGHEIGLHGSFATFLDADIMRKERERLRGVTGTSATGVRQHFLRMRPGLTHQAMADAGFSYDSSFGFPDRNGFRLGAGNVMPVWNNRGSAPLALEEAPLIWMDRALSKYRGIEVPARWVDEGLELARTAEQEEGLWVGLWHPNLTGALGFPGAPAEYRRMVQIIQARHPYVASLENIVEWRKARRSLLARSVTPAGIPVLVADTPGEWPVVLEDGRGNAVERLSWPAAA